ncbi:MAG TPA: type VI secretion system protein TssA [Ramlibacter sp.]|uniref:type VI secretion system protein TssA n=1 Tax=Ramlibacter sp. TaxID=1917967 RepID=UPI002BE30F8A|nr:type VI secretion system protein TssA [Ramlibacter sp.]HVZ43844.1 type VI secretion system protein TssA [Ramlibacter sp.]
MDTESFDPDLPTLLEPVAAEGPCGPSVRYDPAYLAIRQAREEDDPSLPMGEWERPLKRADWRAVGRECAALLARSKDLQLAAWLMDAWLRQHQLRGFIAGTELLAGLVERYWDEVHPLIEDGDSEARIAPFTWLNESLPLTLRLQLPLVFVPDRKPPFLNLADWERLVVPQARSDRADEEDEGFTRELVLAMVDAAGVRWLVQLREQAEEAARKWDELARMLDERLAADAPSLGKVTDTLGRIERACRSLLDGRGGVTARPSDEPEYPYLPAQPSEPEEEPMMSAQPYPADDAAEHPAEHPAERAVPASPGARGEALPTGPITSREEAYRLLDMAAVYLQRTEPHSPTPYLVKRAIAWGQLTLPDLMREVLREEGDLGRFFSMLGINMPR